MQKALATNLRKMREKSGMVQRQVAFAIGKAVPTYQAYEEGRSGPDAETLVRIAELFEINDLRAFICDPHYEEGKKTVRSIKSGSPLQSNYARLTKKERTLVDILLGLREIE